MLVRVGVKRIEMLALNRHQKLCQNLSILTSFMVVIISCFVGLSLYPHNVGK